ncbi:MAG: septal ring lytic transglycosylase RlpA family protein [Acidimicrobiales bacterium]
MWLLVAIVVSVVLVPRAFPPGAPAEAAGEVSVAAGSPDLSVLPDAGLSRPVGTGSTVVLSASVVAPPTTTTEAPPPPTTEAPPAPSTTTTTEAPPAPAAASADPPPPPTTTTTEPPPPPTTTTTEPPPPAPPPEPQPSGRTQEGGVSWYDLPGSSAGVCAHRTIDKGTVVTVTNLDTGESLTCTVNDRGPYSGDGKILDLYRDDFARLAPLEQGVISARIDW